MKSTGVRLTEEFFESAMSSKDAAALLIRSNLSVLSLRNLLRSMWTFGWYSLKGDVRKQYRAKGRYYHYRAMLAEKTRKIDGC